jgi:RNA polymerase II subunit A small phosphatase-like protein
MECVVTNVFPSDLEFEFTWGRERCTRVFDAFSYSESWVKDLKKLKRRGYSLGRVLMVDDTPAKLRRNYGNLVRVTEWLGSPEDEELRNLGRYFVKIHSTPSFRAVEKRGWRTAT